MPTIAEIRAYIRELELAAQRGSREARLELVGARESLRAAERGLCKRVADKLNDRRTHPRVGDWQDKLKDDRRIT